MEEKQTLWARVRAKYRIAVINEKTLVEVLHLRLSLGNLIVLFVATTALTLGLFALLIWSTPLKNYLPGVNAGMREDLMTESARVDSLLGVLSVQQDYLLSIKSVMAGEVESDSVPTLDSIYIIRQTQLLQEESPITENFIEEYENAERDNLNLFDRAVQNDQLANLSRPTAGVVVAHMGESGAGSGIRIQTEDKASVSAVLNGTVVSVTYSIQQGWMIVLQHDADYLSIYSHLEKAMLQAGESVRAGQVLGYGMANAPVAFSLWQHGRCVDPEQVITF